MTRSPENNEILTHSYSSFYLYSNSDAFFFELNLPLDFTFDFHLDFYLHYYLHHYGHSYNPSFIVYSPTTLHAECTLPNPLCVPLIAVYLINRLDSYMADTYPTIFECSDGAILFHGFPTTGIFCVIACP
ncbi:unnamed protein product [Caenorhabditis auriculariae]|uniref:Uncharacterized protein n=1 Tax=Caenorhabditis auriculariae TaxID=2777116 RepID=A0A8S1HVE6_9PELO|nr:unnamed protein product [Caenorhabditis auriculariae]